MTKFLLPVPTHTVGTDFITVQYDRQLIPYLTGLLRNDSEPYNFDPATGDTIAGAYYIQTLIDQLLTEVTVTDSDYEYTAYIPVFTLTPQGSYELVGFSNTSQNGRDYMVNNLPGVGYAFETYTKLNPDTTHKLWIPYVKTNYGCILRITINGVLLSDIDLYSATDNFTTVFKSNDFTTPNKHCLIRLEIIGKNALSSNYYAMFSGLFIT